LGRLCVRPLAHEWHMNALSRAVAVVVNQRTPHAFDATHAPLAKSLHSRRCTSKVAFSAPGLVHHSSRAWAYVKQRRGMAVKPGKRQAKAPRTASLLSSLITAPRRTAGAQLILPGRRGRKPKTVTRFRRCAAMHFGDFPLTFELELELMQARMAQKPVLRGEVGARALRVRSVSREEAWTFFRRYFGWDKAAASTHAGSDARFNAQPGGLNGVYRAHISWVRVLPATSAVERLW